MRELKLALAAGQAFPVDEEQPVNYWTALQLKPLRHASREAAQSNGRADEG